MRRAGAVRLPASGFAKSSRRPARRGEAGYTLMLALFIAAVMIIAASAAVPNLIIQARRQKEKLMIWRGRQYARAIGLYYRKTGHFPHDLQELKHGVNEVHFLRQAYKDPMDSDGSWRLIYLGAGGQLIGSLCWRTLAEYQAAEMGVPIVTATPASTTSDENATGEKKQPTVPTCAMYGQSSSMSSFQPQVITEGGMIGGNLIGVGGQVDKPSVKNYMGADTYRYWEFIWSPEKGSGVALPGAANPNAKGTPNNPSPSGQPGTSAPPGSSGTPSAPPSGPSSGPPSGLLSGPPSGNDQAPQSGPSQQP